MSTDVWFFESEAIFRSKRRGIPESEFTSTELYLEPGDDLHFTFIEVAVRHRSRRPELGFTCSDFPFTSLPTTTVKVNAPRPAVLIRPSQFTAGRNLIRILK